MSTLIEEQYRLVQSALDDEAMWGRLEAGWMQATGHVWKDGHWIAERASNGSLCRGFAVDIETGDVQEGSSSHHNGAHEQLVSRLQNQLRSFDRANARVLNGRMMEIEGFEFPVVHLFCFPVETLEELAPLEKVELGLLAKGYVSLTLVMMRRNFREAEAYRARFHRHKRKRSSP